ncbi:MAG TPA: hypothetical protein IAA93_00010 [Candidatus Avibacteroides avistercoris]|uniref:Uncharacterized protein n=1 Tax=Candidatus Avibacteroides avistercoris TaxID=2840690 RepID=A0A9D2ZTA6_9BACT|nr:hypothetical protein [Candidatus Avibacteroides avistercoris]
MAYNAMGDGIRPRGDRVGCRWRGGHRDDDDTHRTVAARRVTVSVVRFIAPPHIFCSRRAKL